MYDLDKIAANIYWEKRRALEIAAGLRHDAPLFKGRFRTQDDTAIKYRMQAGFPGDINRVHPFSVEPCLINTSTPPTLYGQAVLVDTATNTVRICAVGDSALTNIYGVTVRPYPLQANTTTPTLNSGTPPTSGIIDVLRAGYIMVLLGDGQLAGATKGGQVYVSLTTTGHFIVGSFAATTTSTNMTLATTAALFNGVQDANGIVELEVHQG